MNLEISERLNFHGDSITVTNDKGRITLDMDDAAELLKWLLSRHEELLDAEEE